MPGSARGPSMDIWYVLQTHPRPQQEKQPWFVELTNSGRTTQFCSTVDDHKGTLLSTPFSPLGAQSAYSSWPTQIWPHAIISAMMKPVVAEEGAEQMGMDKEGGLSRCAGGCSVGWRREWPRVGGCHGQQYLQKPPWDLGYSQACTAIDREEYTS